MIITYALAGTDSSRRRIKFLMTDEKETQNETIC